MSRGTCRENPPISTVACGDTHGSPRKFRGHCRGPPPKIQKMSIRCTNGAVSPHKAAKISSRFTALYTSYNCTYVVRVLASLRHQRQIEDENLRLQHQPLLAKLVSERQQGKTSYGKGAAWSYSSCREPTLLEDYWKYPNRRSISSYTIIKICTGPKTVRPGSHFQVRDTSRRLSTAVIIMGVFLAQALILHSSRICRPV